MRENNIPFLRISLPFPLGHDENKSGSRHPANHDHRQIGPRRALWGGASGDKYSWELGGRGQGTVHRGRSPYLSCCDLSAERLCLIKSYSKEQLISLVELQKGQWLTADTPQNERLPSCCDHVCCDLVCCASGTVRNLSTQKRQCRRTYYPSPTKPGPDGFRSGTWNHRFS